jgi:tRNA nucleotidyltransferase (CCA-adding enzyme)
MYIAPEAAAIIEILNNAGYEAYLVGGCVRDSLLGASPKDWDVATSATPDELKPVFADYRVIYTGIKHGTVTVIYGELPVEVTTFRLDGEYLDRRRPADVTFVRGLDADLARRDFTVNALAYHPLKGLIDLFGGTDDLRRKIIRAVGDADTRVNEDGLRILRALRFASVLEFDIDAQLSESIHRNRQALREISAERVNSEIRKLLVGVGVLPILTDYSDVLEVIIPEITPMVGFNQRSVHHCYDVWTHTAKAISYAPKELLTRLALLFHDCGKPATFSTDSRGNGHFYGHAGKSEALAETRLRALKFDNGTIRSVCKLIKHHDELFADKNILRWLNKLGEPMLRTLLDVMFADSKAHAYGSAVKRLAENRGHLAELEKIVAEHKCFSLRDLAVDGDDLITAGFDRGPEIGRMLDYLLNAVLDGKLENDKAALMGALRDK